MAHDPVVAEATKIRDSLEPRFVLPEQEARAAEALEGYRATQAGSVRVLGLDPRADHTALVPRIGVMLQKGGIYPTMTAGQVLDLFAAYYKLETIEHFAKISLVARMLGRENLIAREEVDRPSAAQMKAPASTSASRSMPVSMPMPCNMNTTSSVATLPVAPLAYGHPPKPATDESYCHTPISRQASVLLRACPYVSWKCPDTAFRSKCCNAASIAACTLRGVPTPMVSATPRCCTPRAFMRRDTSATALGATSPWLYSW